MCHKYPAPRQLQTAKGAFRFFGLSFLILILILLLIRMLKGG